MSQPDRFDLERFIAAQQALYPAVLDGAASG